jgi:iron complex outermembrane recepter protein
MPYNDSESQGSYFVDLPDISSSINSIQVQRGVGTSTNGAGAFGGSLNINTMGYEKQAFGETNISYGSYNSLKTNLLASTGLLKNHFVIDARLSRIASDGFVDRATSNLKSFYVSGGFYTDKNFIRLNIFSGYERTYQAWNGIPESRLTGDIQGMKDYISRNGLNDEDAKNLLNSGNRTYNMFTYKDQVDDYQQDHYQLVSSFQLGKNWRFNPMVHYTKGKGYYEEYKSNEKYSKYGLSNAVLDGQSIKRTDFIRRKWLDNDFYGVTYSFDYQPVSKLSASIGGAWNKYLGGHYGEVIWAKVSTANSTNYRWYDNNTIKTDFNMFAKAYYQVNNAFNVFADLQIRTVNFDMNGTDDKIRDASNNIVNFTQTTDYQFFTPKFGLNYKLQNANFYASYSIGKKEPSRQDFVYNFPKSPSPETLHDLEIGYRYTKENLVLAVNFYNMNYIDQLVLTGKVNDVGAGIRVNVPESYRRGIELEASYQFTKTLRISANATFSENKVKNFVEVIPNYDVKVSEINNTVNTYEKTDIAYSPNVIFGGQITYSPSKNLELTWLSKYVGKQYLDNTSNENRKLNGYFTNDLRVNFTVPQKLVKVLTISLLANNLFNTLYESNGYTYSYISAKTIITENFYFPQAGANFLMAIKVRF